MATTHSSAVLVALVLTFGLSGCLSTGSGLLSPSAPGAKSLGAGIIGRSPGAASLSSDARARAVEAEYQALQFGIAGEPIEWKADAFTGQVVPTQLYRVGSQDCRGYRHSVAGPSETLKATGTACKDAKGFWIPVA